MRLLGLFFLLASAAAAHAESAPALVPGTHVTISTPEGFSATDRFPGLLSEETGSSVVVTELPAPYSAATKGFDAAGFKTKGMELLSRDETSFGGMNGLLINASQSAHGINFLKWLGVFGDEHTTYIVTASFPEQHKAQLSERLKSVVAGARADSAANVDPMAALPFRVQPNGSIKVAKVIGMTLLLTKDGIFPSPNPNDPLLLIAPSMTKDMKIQDRKAFAENRLQQLEAVNEIKSVTTSPITVDGLEGFESVGQGVDVRTSASLVVYQVMLFDSDGYYLIQGMASDSARSSQLPVFKQVSRTFKRVSPS